MWYEHWLVRVFVVAFLLVNIAGANNLKIANVGVEPINSTTAFVQFDISWENSWRYEVDNDPLYLHDAAWVFFKVQRVEDHIWQHVKLLTDLSSAVAGTGTAIELKVPGDGVGVFIRRATEGSGTNSVQGIKMVWSLPDSGITKKDQVKVQAFGIEMVYVAEGAFYVGDGLKDSGQLFEGGEGNDPDNPQPFKITSAGAIECDDKLGCLWGASQSGNNSMGGKLTIPATFPNGYSAFYCMKYLVTQGQYTDFLNTLTRVQQRNRCPAVNVGDYMSNSATGAMQDRNNIKLVSDESMYLPSVYGCTTPDYGCNFLTWADLTAFTAWAGLRPITELEFEKAGRGPLYPVPGEYAWGNANIINIGTLQGIDGSGEEYYTTGNLLMNGTKGPTGPMRVGVFAKPGTEREESGASFWGIMELSGHLWERPVTFANATGRNFNGVHGSGGLDEDGNAAVPNWPNTGASGTGSCSGGFNNAISNGRLSDRLNAHRALNTRFNTYGGRAVRTCP